MTVFYCTLESPIGPLTLTSDGTHLTGLFMENHKGFANPASLGPAASSTYADSGTSAASATGTDSDTSAAPGINADSGTSAAPRTNADSGLSAASGISATSGSGVVCSESVEPFPLAIEELRAYFAGNLQNFSIPFKASGTQFQMRVWQELSKIPFGEVISYGELARRIDNPNACRAVGLANGQNPISIIVPCHRVIGANGKLTGYGGGLPRKQALLGLEQTAASTTASIPKQLTAASTTASIPQQLTLI